MARLVREARVDLAVRALAVAIIAGIPHTARADQAEAIQQWVQKNIEYVADVHQVETLTPPAYLLSTRAGDCDDQAMLSAALLEAVGFPTRLVAGGPAPGTYVHVWTEVQIRGVWYAAETTKPWDFGRRPPLPFTMVEIP